MTNRSPEIAPANTPQPVEDRQFTRFSLILIAVVTLLAEGLALHADFYMDDFKNVLQREAVTGGEFNPPHVFRTLPYLMYRGIYATFKESSVAFHVPNVLLHLGIAFTVFTLGKLLFRRLDLLRSEEIRERAALVGALIFASHPLCSEAVNYMRCSMIQMVTLFSMLASYHALKWTEKPNWRSIAYVVLFLALASYSKDPGIFHAFINLGVLGILFFNKQWLSRAREWSGSINRGSLIAGTVAATGIMVWLLSKWVSIAYFTVARSGTTYFDHWFTQGRMLWGIFVADGIARGSLQRPSPGLDTFDW